MNSMLMSSSELGFLPVEMDEARRFREVIEKSPVAIRWDAPTARAVPTAPPAASKNLRAISRHWDGGSVLGAAGSEEVPASWPGGVCCAIDSVC